jgi:hypothetical protein
MLCMVHPYHDCMAQHLHDRFWVPDSVLSACYRRIVRLTLAGYLTVTRLPSTTGSGSGKTFSAFVQRCVVICCFTGSILSLYSSFSGRGRAFSKSWS